MYRLYTECLKRKRVEVLCQSILGDCTTYSSQGIFPDGKERCLIIDAIDLDDEREYGPLRTKMIFLASEINKLNNQSETLVCFLPSKCHLISNLRQKRLSQ